MLKYYNEFYRAIKGEVYSRVLFSLRWVFFGALHVFYPLIFPHAKLGIQANGAALI